MKKYWCILSLATGICFGEISCSKNSTALNKPGKLSQTLVSTLQNNYSFSLFYHALRKTGLDQLISGATPYTLLVPDNDAFARDSIFRDSDLDKMDTTFLRKWMSYHILPGSVTTATVPQTVNTPYQSISGQVLYFSRPVPGQSQTQTNINTILHINGDTVNTVDVTASNGVVQVMNRLLKLPAPSVQSYLIGDPRYSWFVTALQRFGLWDVLTGPGPFTVFAPDNDSFTNLGITPDSLSHLDTLHYKTSLFGIYVLGPSRIFLTDFYDAGNGSGFAAYFTANGIYWSLGGNLIDNNPTGTSSQTTWVDADNITVNGVVQGIDGLLLTPDQAIK